METTNRMPGAQTTPTLHGQFVWYDLMTRDVDAAKRFYGAVVGWTTQPMEGAEPAYDMWVGPAGPLGGVMTLTPEMAPPGTPPHWLAYVAVLDVDAATNDARAAGAKVLLAPTPIPNVGRFSIIADPQGAVIALFTPVGPPEVVPSAPQPGQFSWHELATTDPEAATAFYTALFGWKDAGSFDMGPMGTYRLFENGPGTRGGIFRRVEGMPAPSWLLYIRVSSLETALERLRAAGGKVINGPMEVPSGDHVAACLDDQGAAFALHEVAAT